MDLRETACIGAARPHGALRHLRVPLPRPALPRALSNARAASSRVFFKICVAPCAPAPRRRARRNPKVLCRGCARQHTTSCILSFGRLTISRLQPSSPAKGERETPGTPTHERR
jgi:hypothetical protein